MARAKFEIKRKCEICGAWFYAKTVESRFCSKKCSEIASKKKKAEIEKLAKLEELVANIPDSRDYISVQEAAAALLNLRMSYCYSPIMVTTNGLFLPVGEDFLPIGARCFGCRQNGKRTYLSPSNVPSPTSFNTCLLPCRYVVMM